MRYSLIKNKNMKLSIITVCYNNKTGLEKTLRSVGRQTCKDFEYIVIDGASTDGSVDLLKQYSAIIDYKVSEKDNGIYNAMNKGIKYAHGEYCLFLNSGDILYEDNTIKKVLPTLGQADFISGDTIGIDDKKMWKAPLHITTYLMAIYSLSHQSTFIRTSLLKNRPYREDLKIVADWEQMFYEIIIKDKIYQRLNIIVCGFECGGVSFSKSELRELERKKILDEHFSERMQKDIVHPNLLVYITALADYGSKYYKTLEFFARVIRKIYRK